MKRWACGLLAAILSLAGARAADEKTVADTERRVAELITALKAKDAAARKDAAKALAEVGAEARGGSGARRGDARRGPRRPPPGRRGAGRHPPARRFGAHERPEGEGPQRPQTGRGGPGRDRISCPPGHSAAGEPRGRWRQGGAPRGPVRAGTNSTRRNRGRSGAPRSPEGQGRRGPRYGGERARRPWSPCQSGGPGTDGCAQGHGQRRAAVPPPSRSAPWAATPPPLPPLSPPC